MYVYIIAILGTLTGLIISLIKLAQVKNKLPGLLAKLALLEDNFATKQTELATQQRENIYLVKRTATLEAEKKELQAKWEEREDKDKAREEKLALQFNKLANELLTQGGDKLVTQNKTQLESLLTPLKEKIATFERQVTRAHEETLARNVALRTELEKIHSMNLKITQEAKNLTNAIKGDTKLQGNWGEFILESLLDKSGLVKNREYFIQEAFVTAEGKRYRPDVVVKLPDEKPIVIDAKVSLISYEKFFNAENVEEQKIHLKKHIQSLKNHIKELASKNYAQEYNIQGLDFVFMFIPIEPAYSIALQHDHSLFHEAYQQNILLVNPSTLMATLRTVAHIWQREYQNRNALEIAHHSGVLFDKFVSFVENLKKIGYQITTTQKTYETAIKQLSEGRGNLIDKVQRLKALGARTSKNLESSSELHIHKT